MEWTVFREQCLDPFVFDHLGQLLELGRAGLRHAGRRRNHRANDLESVAIRVISEGVVVGDQLAALGR